MNLLRMKLKRIIRRQRIRGRARRFLKKMIISFNFIQYLENCRSKGKIVHDECYKAYTNLRHNILNFSPDTIDNQQILEIE